MTVRRNRLLRFGAGVTSGQAIYQAAAVATTAKATTAAVAAAVVAT